MTKRSIRYDPDNDLYTVLGIQAAAPVEEIHRAFRQRAKQVHPDLNPDRADWAHAQFQRVNDAHDILSDPTLRREYDEKRRLRLLGLLPERNARTTTTMAEASRAAWSYRHRRNRFPAGLFFIFLLMTVGSCLALQWGSFSRDESIEPKSSPPNDLLPVVIAPTLTPNAVCSDPNAVITDPPNDSEISGPFSIRGTASGRAFISYTVSIGVPSTNGAAPHWFPLIEESTHRVEADQLVPQSPSTNYRIALLVTTLNPDFLLHLAVHEENSQLAECEIIVHVARPTANNTATQASSQS